MDIREAINIVVSGNDLLMDDAASVMRQIMSGEATQAQLGSLLTALRLKGETNEEIAGMATIMREFSLRVNVDGMAVDSVGTGGDGLNTFNISTAAAFVAAGAGLKVAKHGNRAASGTCGSADVLEELGVKIELSPEGVERCIRESGIGFMFAQAFHPSMRHAGPVRREIGIRTVFNILGPLTNPAGAQSMLVGVAFPDLGEKMASVLNLLDTHHSIVVYGDGGLDEMTLAGNTAVWEVAGGKVSNWTLSVADTGLPITPIEAVRGGDKAANAATMRALLRGEGGPVRDYVLLNGAGVLLAGDLVTNIRDGVQLAAQTIDSGAAKACMESMIEASRSA
ncbi:MAG: anthranilate phosphoribosyltransferase [Dehalococcoidia bacterium]|nr:anthranilate phosphoribosyltransferase [Dehalococcoidia bacterium]